MPDPEATFLRRLAKANIALLAAHQTGDPERAIVALRELLRVIVEPRDGGSHARRDAALVRAVERR